MGSVPILIWNPASRLDPLYDAEDAGELPVQLAGGGAAISLIYPRGQVLGEVAATPGVYAPYNDTAGDGTQVAKMILRYKTLSLGVGAGQLTWVGGEWGVAYSPNATTAFKSGDFDLSQLVGLDANSITDMAGHIVQGALAVSEIDSFAQTGGSGTWNLTIPALTVSGLAYAALTVAGLSATITAAALVTAVNAALVAAGYPGYVSATGGALGTNPIVVTFRGALSGQNMIVTVDNTGMSGGTVAVTRSTNGAAPFGVVRFG